MMDCLSDVSSDMMLDEMTVGQKSLAQQKDEGMAPSLASQMVAMMDELSGVCLAKKMDCMMERMMDDLSDMSLARKLDSLMVRKMDDLSDVSLEKKKVDLTVTMLE